MRTFPITLLLLCFCVTFFSVYAATRGQPQRSSARGRHSHANVDKLLQIISGYLNKNREADLGKTIKISSDKGGCQNFIFTIPGVEKRKALSSASSSELLAAYQHEVSQRRTHADLPPALIDTRGFNKIQSPRRNQPEVEDYNRSNDPSNEDFDNDPTNANSVNVPKVPTQDGDYQAPIFGPPQRPATPKWDFSLNVKGQLQVPMSEFTETYEMWFDAASGEVAVNFYNGATRTYRMARPDRTYQEVAVVLNRAGERTVVECRAAPPRRARRSAGGAAPGLPDMALFTFRGYRQISNMVFELWGRTVVGAEGQLGASAGERLTFHHDVVVTRKHGKPMPVEYSVRVDSSLLGPDVDKYAFTYTDAQEMQHAADTFQYDIEENCEVQTSVDPEDPLQAAHLDPLKQYTGPGRDPLYDTAYNLFIVNYDRDYESNQESAIRKNVLIKNTRFVEAINRQGLSFILEMNKFGDLIESEIDLWHGVDLSSEGSDKYKERFPYSDAWLEDERHRLPAFFSWRSRGGVSKVGNQISCRSCWAFAIAGAVEGAVFAKTNKLVVLSEKCLFECAREYKYGTNNCSRGSHVDYAFNYVKDHGLPRKADYGEYKPYETPCKKEVAEKPVIRISSYVEVPPHNFPAIQVAIKMHGPTVVVINGKALANRFYKSGIYIDSTCKPSKNHAVLAVGWGRNSTTNYLLLKNSWGADWGHKGYIRVGTQHNTCGVLSKPLYPRLQDSDLAAARRGLAD